MEEDNASRRGSWLPGTITVGLLALCMLLPSVVHCGNHHASIKSKYGHQLVTSSTLRWRAQSRGGSQQPKDAVSCISERGEVVCRAEHHGTLLLGQTDNGYCAVGFVNKLYKKQKYEILVNEDQAARLEWRPYAKFTAVPEGAVAAVDNTEDHLFVGRFLDSSSSLPGSIAVHQPNYNFGAMTVFDGNGAVREVSSGEVMVEVEPERYELHITETANDSSSSSSRPKVTRQDVVLAKSSLFRFDEGKDREARLQKVLSYDYERSEYYGQVPGTIRALPATITLQGGQLHSALWGLPQTTKQRETLMVGHLLKHQTAVDVSVVGVRVVEEKSYSGVITAVFADGDRRQRKVEGVVQRRYLNNIRPEYSRVYQIKDSVVVSANTPAASDDTTTEWSSHGGNDLQQQQEKDKENTESKERRDRAMLADQSKEKTLSSAVTSSSSGSLLLSSLLSPLVLMLLLAV